MKAAKKYKMNKGTYNEYVRQGIFKDMEKPKWGKNRSAIIIGKGRTTTKEWMNVEIEVLGYFAQANY